MKLINVIDIINTIENNPLYSWRLRTLGCKYFEGNVESSGDKFWYKNGKYHRDSGPAREVSNGSKYWYNDGKLHRDDGPAIEDSDGHKEWYKEGKWHRLDGPAFECSNGIKHWYLEGIEYSLLEFKRKKVSLEL